MEKEAVKRKSRLVANLRPARRAKSSAEAAAQVNTSPRLVQYAIKVLEHGCGELVAAVESGALAVSTASVLAGLPEEEQKSVVAGGVKEAARKVRELRGGKSDVERTAPGPRPSPGCFGVVGVEASGTAQSVEPGVVLLWVAPGGLGEAIEARGFRYLPSAA